MTENRIYYENAENYWYYIGGEITPIIEDDFKEMYIRPDQLMIPGDVINVTFQAPPGDRWKWPEVFCSDKGIGWNDSYGNVRWESEWGPKRDYLKITRDLIDG